MMKLNQILIVVLIVIITSFFMVKIKKKPTVTKVYIEQQYQQQHSQYPHMRYDIREILPPSRRNYMRYPYYASHYGMFMR